ncbi:26S proteasome non-ATPase regulatory subunit 3-like [Limulus polyphemus]|uniref:26S proteasome non-ATPase regulatory subunit 3-like n=1 Tax=Limulus polyphemus TaxID=6850 RepID=A0ABM1B2V7_LIMPO|nr:26S proteasome non-ATPase regulatory subunit 3-like [Limulus polyphemus]XP_022240677.1 26S proteasome non-ATPase regulatory subunit 3-like [Limulus polyphemus]
MIIQQGTDVEMKNAEDQQTGNSSTEGETVKQDTDLLTIEDLKEHARHIEKSVSSKEPRFIFRVLRALVTTRKKLNSKVLRKIICGFYTHSVEQRDSLLTFVDEPMDTEGQAVAFKARTGKAAQLPLLPELDVYFHLLVLLYLIDLQRIDQAVKCSNLLMQKVHGNNRRSLDLLASKCYFYHSRCYELADHLKDIRSFLHSRLRTATLRNDYEGQAVLLNCLLRNYLHYNLYEQAAKLVSKSVFPDMASNNEWARFLYYLGCIKAIQLEYSEAHKNLLQAIRKAPQHTAVGFKQTVNKLAITVELLLGDIPDRSIFRQPTLRRTLAPYFQLTQAVRTGNLGRFNEVLENFGAKFQADHTYTLIIRLRHNVIKTGVRMINLSYSRISLADIAQKLELDSSEDAEFIVAKAIRDGVIEATIDHEKGCMQSKENIDIYCTREPQAAFHQRISFCLDIHNHSVKAMRFPPKSYNKDLESAEVRLCFVFLAIFLSLKIHENAISLFQIH